MSRAAAPIAALAAFLLATAAGAGAAPDPKRLALFREKCGLCHGLKKTLAEFPGMTAARRAEVVADMADRKPGWISDAERAEITALLVAADYRVLAAALKKPKRSAAPKAAAAPVSAPATAHDAGPAADVGAAVAPAPEPAATVADLPAEAAPDDDEAPTPERARYAWRQRVAVAHGALMLAVLLGFALAAALSGLKLLLDKRQLLPRFPGAFVWKRHVRKGKIAALGALGGLAGGLAVFALGGFAIAAAPHFAAGCAIAALYAAGGLAGLRLAAGRGTPALRRLHAACNLAATALFAFNAASGVALAVSLVG